MDLDPETTKKLQEERSRREKIRPRNTFLKAIDELLRRDEGRLCGLDLKDGVETTTWEWGTDFKDGYLLRDDSEKVWQRTEPLGSRGIWINASSDREVIFHDGMQLLSSTLRDADDLPELMHMFIHAKLRDIEDPAFVRRKLSSVIDKAFYAFGRGSASEIQMIPVDGSEFPKGAPVMGDYPEGNYTHGFVSPLDDYFRDLNAFLSSEVNSGGAFKGLTMESGDLILSNGGIVDEHEVFFGWEDDYSSDPPFIVLRLRDNVSRMWFGDFLEFAREAEGLVESIVANWKSLPRILGETEIYVPSRKEAQIGHAIELRQARDGYLNSIHRLSSIREPFKEMSSLYRKRTKAVEAIYGESLDDIEAIQRPLPFFLEYPYRHFRKEDDHMVKVRAAQRLLGVLAKVPLFLVVEELLSKGHNLGAGMLAKLEERAPSDGALVGFQRTLATELAKEPRSALSIFSPLLDLMRNTDNLDAMVSARNRMHHEPYDEDGFLRTVSEHAPRVIDRLRDALADCHFIVPQHGRMLSGEKVITAEDACSSDAHFRTIHLKVSLPLEQFPSGELMVWSSTQKQTLMLGKLLTSKLVTRQSRDFGIFDRMQKNERHFTFLRSE